MVSEPCRERTSSLLTVALLLGDILIFMPGQEDIEVTCEVIKGLLNRTSSPADVHRCS